MRLFAFIPLFTSSILICGQAFAQTVTTWDTVVVNDNNDIRFDVDGDGFHDVGFTLTYFFDAKFMRSYAVTDSVYVSRIASTGAPFQYYDSLRGIAMTSILCYDWGGAGVQFGNIQHVGFYKKLSAVDSVFGYFTVMAHPDLTENCQDSLFIYSSHLVDVTNDTTFAGEFCEFEFSQTLDVGCTALCEGALEPIPISGAAPFTYNWSNGDVTPTADTLCWGEHTVEITDAAGCVWRDTLYVDTVVTQVDFNLGYFNPNAQPGCNITIFPVVSGGNPPFSYFWPSTGSTTVGGPCPGWHVLNVTDNNGCQFTDSVFVDSGFYTLASDYEQLCYPYFCSAEMNAVAVGGTAPYTLYMPDAGITPMVDSAGVFQVNYLCPGVYEYFIVDGNGDTAFNTIEIIPANVNLVIVSVTPPSCTTCTDGGVVISATGGSPPYMFTMDDGVSTPVVTTSGNYTNLGTGTYTFCAEDGNGCEDCTAISLDTSGSCYLLSNVMTTNCQLCTGIVEVFPQGFQQPVTYSWSNGETDDDAHNLCPGVISVQVTGAGGCVVNASFDVSSDPLNLGTGVQVKWTSCPEVCDAQTSLNSFNPPFGQTMLGYRVDGGPFNIGTTITDLCPGTHTITAYNQDFCTDDVTLYVYSYPSIQPDSTLLQDPACYLSCNGALYYTVLNNNTPISVLSTGGVLDSLGADGFWLTSLCSDTLFLEIQDTLGCTLLDTLVFGQPDSVYFTYTQTALASCDTCSDGQGMLTIAGGTPPYTVDWTDLGSNSDSSMSIGLNAGSGVVCVTDSAGCSYCDSVSVAYSLGMGEWAGDARITLLPNPATDWVVLHSSLNLDEVALFDAQGKLLWRRQATGSRFAFSVDGLTDGVYLVETRIGGRAALQRLVVRE